VGERPRLLDLYAGAGGSARGYQLAGFHVTGVDIKAQPRYAGDAFHQADALEFLAEHGHEYDAVHASPPCQAYTALRSIRSDREYPDLLAATRAALIAIGLTWVIENVPGSPVHSGTTLCGSMFGLGAHCRDGAFHQLRRHRHFESSILLLASSCSHIGRPVGVYGNGGGNEGRGYLPGINGFTGNAQERREAMGIDWMNRYELSQAIPPAYTRLIGARLLESLSLERVS
jgi:DNA (cytosine-5)-methyltransferase 1